MSFETPTGPWLANYSDWEEFEAECEDPGIRDGDRPAWQELSRPVGWVLANADKPTRDSFVEFAKDRVKRELDERYGDDDTPAMVWGTAREEWESGSCYVTVEDDQGEDRLLVVFSPATVFP